MLDFTLEAEKLMAATTSNEEGGLGMPVAEWREFIGDRPDTIEERDRVAQWLHGFTRRALCELQQEDAKRTLEQMIKDLDRGRT